MIGYLKPQKHMFDHQQKEAYQAIYCGLCRTLNYEYGIRGTFLVNYEIVDILLIIDALLNIEPSVATRSCSITPFLWKKMVGFGDELFQIGAAISVIIVALELNDNVIDDGSIKDKALYSLIKPAKNKAKSTYPNVWNMIESAYKEYMQLENISKKSNSGFYTVLSSCGTITRRIGEILGGVISNEYAYIIGMLMYYWGEWTYLLDAIDDYDKDNIENKFNPLLLMDCPVDVLKILQDLEENALALIENLPFRRYQNLIFDLLGKHFPEKRRLICQISKYSCEE